MRGNPDTESPLIVPALNTTRARQAMLGCQVDPACMQDTVAILDGWICNGERNYVCCVSVHGLVTAQRDDAVRAAINGAALATQDGMPLVWWSRLAGRNASRVCGPDLMAEICRHGVARRYRHYLYGGTPETLIRLQENLQLRYPDIEIVGHRAPPFRALTPAEDLADVEAINQARPDFVWVGLGMPKQEKWMASHVGRVEAAALFGVGAAFDFHAGLKSRAPAWMQRSGTEWMWRLACEPRRLARRYVIDNTLFLLYVLRQLSGLSHAVTE